MTKQRGFSLIEALIALVVLSFGLIGMAAMQLKALQSATQSYQRSVVTLAAVDAQERLWAGLPTSSSCNNIKEQTPFVGDESWEDYWFNGDTPLKNLKPPDDIGGSNCEFTITIDLNGDNFEYKFRLPDPEDL